MFTMSSVLSLFYSLFFSGKLSTSFMAPSAFLLPGSCAVSSPSTRIGRAQKKIPRWSPSPLYKRKYLFLNQLLFFFTPPIVCLPSSTLDTQWQSQKRSHYFITLNINSYTHQSLGDAILADDPDQCGWSASSKQSDQHTEET